MMGHVLHTVSLKLFYWFLGSRFLKDFYHICGHGGHLGQVTNIMLINFHSHVSKAYIQNLVKIGLVVSEKSKF